MCSPALDIAIWYLEVVLLAVGVAETNNLHEKALRLDSVRRGKNVLIEMKALSDRSGLRMPTGTSPMIQRMGQQPTVLDGPASRALPHESNPKKLDASAPD